jgi:iron complex outermembrane receptor protein
LFTAALPCSAIASQDVEPITPNTLFEMSLEQLMDLPIVFSASRTEQKISQSAVPVSILTAADIHDSGATSIPELLRFVPGVDVRRLDRSRYSVGVRGMIGQYSDRTLVPDQWSHRAWTPSMAPPTGSTPRSDGRHRTH